MTKNIFINSIIFLLIASLLIIVNCCGIQSNKDSAQNVKNNIFLNLVNIEFALKKYEIQIRKDSTLTWYYPYQMIFEFQIVNLNNSNVFFASKETIYNKGKVYGKIRCFHDGNEFSIGSNTYRIINSLDTSFFNGYIIDFPIFENIYYYEEFSDFLKNFIVESRYEYYPIRHDYLDTEFNAGENVKNFIDVEETDSKSKKINISLDLNYQFNHWKDGEIELKQIGYPLLNVPNDIKIMKPIHGIEY